MANDRGRSWKESPYWILTKFTAPLLLTSIATDVAEQALNRTLTGTAQVAVELGAFSLAFKVLRLLNSVHEDIKYASVVYMHSKRDRFKILLVGAILTVGTSLTAILLGVTPVGIQFFQKLHNVSDTVGNKSRTVLLYFSVYPLLDSVAWIHTGALIQRKHSVIAGGASLCDVITQIISVVIFLQTNISNKLLIPVISCYLGMLVRLLIVVSGYYYYIHSSMPDAPSSGDGLAKAEEEVENSLPQAKEVTIPKVLRMLAPLAAVRLSQQVSRPFVNIFVMRDRKPGMTEEDALKSVAAMAVCFPLSHTIYGPLNELKALEPTFSKRNIKNGGVRARTIRLYSCVLFVVALLFMFVLFWVPAVRLAVLTGINNLNDDIAALCATPLKVLTVLPLLTLTRSLVTGWIVKIKKTWLLYPSVVARMLFTLFGVLVLPKVGVHGAAMGISSFVIGYGGQSLVTYLAAIFVKCRQVRRRDDSEEAHNLGDIECEEDSNAKQTDVTT